MVGKRWAYRIHAHLVGLWLRSGIDLVVDEGTSSPSEVHEVVDQVPDGTYVFHVVLTADYDASLARARADPGRGVSKNAEFLRADHEDYSRQVLTALLDFERTPRTTLTR